MKWLEVIRVRSVGKDSGLVQEFLLAVDKTAQSGLVEVKTYHHAALETDFSAHLIWDSDHPQQNGSALGLRLTHALKEFGLIDHSIWIETRSERTF